MAFVPVLDTVSASMRFTLWGQQIESTLYFKHSGEPTTEDLQDIADYVDDFAASKLLAAGLSVSMVYRETFVTWLATVTSPTAVSTVSAGATGSDGDASLPGNVCFCVTFRTAERGRSARGRNYVSGIPVGSQTGNTIPSAFADGIVGAYNALIEFPLADWTWVVVSRTQGGVSLLNGVTLPVTQAAYADLNLDSQRRRLTGRGN